MDDFDDVFNIFPENYHKARPSYPEEIFADIKEECDINQATNLLEIGAGSGIATKKLAQFGAKITAIEPGEKLAEIAKKNVGRFDNVEIRKTTFEDYPDEEKFDILTAFNAFHWLEEDTKFNHSKKLLKSDSYLAIIQSGFLQKDLPIFKEINEIYGELLYNGSSGSSPQEINEMVFSKINGRLEEIIENSLFYIDFLNRYYKIYEYDSDSYPALLKTFPSITKLKPKKSKEFLSRISEVVENYGPISLPILTTLIICRKQDFLLEN